MHISWVSREKRQNGSSAEAKKADHNESIACLLHRLQRHEHTFHHSYLYPAHLRRPTEHSLTPLTPSSPMHSASQSNLLRPHIRMPSLALPFHIGASPSVLPLQIVHIDLRKLL
ncbi:uncharacterized protein BJ212DRAFT_796429 [Suillus subaureus]|uniref:Uncharacterized protein n=1 Tax=Suillus subaureus TaxID=48587 RepID=A0A9P7J6V5_9AGAM|nr:uncharacterized protein BJ212DRAFT_796429 [Suillus subaureus]KAG1805936.1 hypothetical protein BJ212DRAFT_796429 [Suillus subaureus]